MSDTIYMLITSTFVQQSSPCPQTLDTYPYAYQFLPLRYQQTTQNEQTQTCYSKPQFHISKCYHHSSRGLLFPLPSCCHTPTTQSLCWNLNTYSALSLPLKGTYPPGWLPCSFSYIFQVLIHIFHSPMKCSLFTRL